MPIFNYRAKNSQGQDVSGTVEASTRETAIELLLEKELIVLEVVDPIKGEITLDNIPFLNRIKVKDVVILSRQLSVMISAQMPVVQSLHILKDQTSNFKLKKIVQDISDEVDGGSQLSVAMSKYPKVFDDFFVSMIKTGETTGRLDKVLNYLADQKERDYQLRSKIKSMTIYPVFVFSMLVIVGAIVMIFIVPNLINVIMESGGELPWTTKMLIAVSNLFVNWWWLMVLVVVGGAIGFKGYTASEEGHRQWDTFKLRVPLLGKLFQRIYLVRFGRSLATLSDGGVPLPYALEVVAGVVGNLAYADLILQTKKEVEDGNSLAGVFLASDVVPPMMSQSLAVGEKSGKLGEVLSKVSDFYAQEVENMMSDLITLIEPAVIVLLGVGVAIMVAAVILPMYNLSASI